MSKANTSSTIALAAVTCCISVLLPCPEARAQSRAANDAAASTPADPASGATAQGGDADLLNDILAAPVGGAASAAPPAQGQPDEPLPSSASAPSSAGTPIPVTGSPSNPAAGNAAEPPDRFAPHGRQIEEIVVTATKREESVRDIPESISAFTGAGLENQGKLSLLDFIEQSPGVTASQGSAGFTRITMRGISTDTSPYAGTPSPVGIFIGDTAFTDPYTSNITPDLSAFDLAGVQVLKGPQGTLFGGAALSGAVRYELQEPVIGQFQLRGFSQYSHPTDGGQALTNGGAVNLPIWTSQGVALRIDYVDRHYPGVYEDQRTGEKAVDHANGNQIRAIALWEPSDAWKFKFTHLTQRSDTPFALILADSPHGPRENDNTLVPLPSTNRFDLDNLELNYNFDSVFRIVSSSSRVAKYATFTGDDTLVLINTPPANYPTSAAALSTVVDNAQDFSQELRIQSTSSGPFKWLAGAYYFSYHGYFNILIDTPTQGNLIAPGSLVTTVADALGVPGALITANTPLLEGISISGSKERAFFTDETLDLFGHLELEAGVRLYETEVTGGYTGTGVLVLGEDNLMDTDTEGSLNQKGVNPKFSATYRFTDDISLYGMAAKGFRFGGTQDIPSTPTNGVPATFKSDTLWNYETGLRTSWLDKTLNFDVTGFYLFYKNPIISQSTTGAIPLAYSDNVSSAISRGVEINTLWNTPLDGLSLSAAGGITDAHITAQFKASTGGEVQPGQEMPGASRLQGTSSIDYRRLLWIAYADANVGYTYVGAGYNDLTHDVRINGFGTLNAGLNFGTDLVSFHPKLAFNATNILNVARPNAGETGTALVTQTPYAQYTLNPPRTISVRLSFDF